MLPAKYQPNWHSGSGEEIVLMFLLYMSMAASLKFES